MPPLFRTLFGSVASEFEFWKRDHLSYLKRPSQSFTLSSEELRRILKAEHVDQTTLLVLADYDFFAIPRVALTQAQLGELRKEFAGFLKERSKQGIVITGKRTQNLFGSQHEWEAFVRIYPFVDWETRPPGTRDHPGESELLQMSRPGLAKGIQNFVDWDNTTHHRPEDSEIRGHAKDYWENMQRFMFGLYNSEASYDQLLLQMLLPLYPQHANLEKAVEPKSQSYQYHDSRPRHEVHDFLKAVPFRMFQKVRSMWELRKGTISPLQAADSDLLIDEVLNEFLV